jgi:20S proteasome subunit beta 7
MGASVLAIRYKDGVMMSADTQVSYGSLARYKDVQRMHCIGEHTLLGASGEHSDVQFMLGELESKTEADICADDGMTYGPRQIYTWMRTMMYERRNKFDPLWNNFIVAGHKNGEAFLGTVDMIGTHYEENFLATGYGSYLCIPIFRKKWRADMDEGEARALLEDCQRLLFYRHCNAYNQIQISKATAEGVIVSPPYKLDTNWDVAAARDAAPADVGGW